MKNEKFSGTKTENAFEVITNLLKLLYFIKLVTHHNGFLLSILAGEKLFMPCYKG